MKTLIQTVVVAFGITAFGTSLALAQSPFNGTFCGKGLVFLNQGENARRWPGGKIVTLNLTESAVGISYDRVYFQYDGGIMMGEPVQAHVENRSIIYNGQVIGKVTDNSIHAIFMTNYRTQVEYQITSTGNGKISYSMISNDPSTGERIVEQFPELQSGPDCKER